MGIAQSPWQPLAGGWWWLHMPCFVLRRAGGLLHWRLKVNGGWLFAVHPLFGLGMLFMFRFVHMSHGMFFITGKDLQLNG